jgi:hypothetical protein
VYSNVTVLVVGEEGVERCTGKQTAEEKRTAKKTEQMRNMPSTREVTFSSLEFKLMACRETLV